MENVRVKSGRETKKTRNSCTRARRYEEEDGKKWTTGVHVQRYAQWEKREREREREHRERNERANEEQGEHQDIPCVIARKIERKGNWGREL